MRLLLSRPLMIAVSFAALTTVLAGCKRPSDTPPPTTTTTTPMPPTAPASAASK